MSERRHLFSDVSWFQVFASALAAVTAAWIASSLGVAGTLVGAALGSFVVTLSSAFYARTLDRGRTLLVQTERGTIIERHVDEGEVSDAFDEAGDVDSPVVAAEFLDAKRPLQWKTILVTSAIVLAVALAGITAYELIVKHPLGNSGGGTTIGDTVRGGPKEEPTETPTTTEPTTRATSSTPRGSTVTGTTPPTATGTAATEPPTTSSSGTGATSAPPG
ncbi:hypothetical protein [Aeromicrobium sp.]